MATAYFMEMIAGFTDAEKDQNHIKTIVYSNPEIPDRTAFVLGRSDEDPVPSINEAARLLSKMGADVIAIPCITAHCFHKAITENVDALILNAVEETALSLQRDKISKAGIMATDGSLKCGLFRDALKNAEIEALEPSSEVQRLIMELIYDDIKAGKKADPERLKKITRHFADRGSEALILGCTELSLVNTSIEDIKCYDAMEILAKASISRCGYKIREDSSV